MNKKVVIIIITCLIVLPPLLLLAPYLFIVALLVGMVIFKLKFPQIKGAVGEAYVNRILSQLGTNYTIYHDLYIPNDKGGTTQIDHVVTSPFGIFVIETKHYEGWIFGKENQKYWTQVIYKRKEKLFNPIWQNRAHVEALKTYLDKEDKGYFHSIIVFSTNSTFKFDMSFTSAVVIQFPQLLSEIKQRNAQSISGLELRAIDKALEQVVITDKQEKRQVKRKHVEVIKNNRANERKQEVHDNICPKCGGQLSVRSGEFGSFLGCSNYPKCRYTNKVS
ncbi:NERD domain-containing protein [Alkalihalobacterium bogoriense]|uniref:NERD domain-containing protein n=1 Tax=Alkalihalobacterium bogoriense TaxID=246272 RepID=UPI00055640F5|nr:NERD domain-containing protein [Alkalihalobacterium bogoriense]